MPCRVIAASVLSYLEVVIVFCYNRTVVLMIWKVLRNLFWAIGELWRPPRLVGCTRSVMTRQRRRHVGPPRRK